MQCNIAVFLVLVWVSSLMHYVFSLDFYLNVWEKEMPSPGSNEGAVVGGVSPYFTAVMSLSAWRTTSPQSRLNHKITPATPALWKPNICPCWYALSKTASLCYGQLGGSRRPICAWGASSPGAGERVPTLLTDPCFTRVRACEDKPGALKRL